MISRYTLRSLPVIEIVSMEDSYSDDSYPTQMIVVRARLKPVSIIFKLDLHLSLIN